MKKILGTSGAQSMRWLSLQPSNPGHYIEDCRILRLYVVDLLQKWALSQNRKIVSEWGNDITENYKDFPLRSSPGASAILE